MTLAIDYSARPPKPATIANAGYRTVCRYLSRYTGKALTPTERDGLLAAGLDIVLVFEDGADNALKGAGQGHADGTFAAGQARDLGAPAGTVIYFAVDVDTQDHATIGAYLDAAAPPLHGAGYRVGVYGSHDVCAHALDGGHAEAAWQTRAWSGTPPRIETRAALYQRAETVTLDGTQCDINDIRHPNYGGWRSPLEDDMPTVDEFWHTPTIDDPATGSGPKLTAANALRAAVQARNALADMADTLGKVARLVAQPMSDADRKTLADDIAAQVDKVRVVIEQPGNPS